ncbi:MAG: DEAD/DEAH box helicase family protein [Verrucomicrobiales bacterium]|jgi:superfamily II DNA or RNA helicase|nr:DEAD/DEAH box helicase family protein [Verrucomicrobiales bacterium]MDB4627002.1 DEAD/DEAH box helicase family protein [bacterium]MDB4627015.1 DEAD/DEAH box helicase family protein [bacterium]
MLGNMTELQFDKGTLILHRLTQEEQQTLQLAGVQWDQRTQTHRAPAWYYREIILQLRQNEVAHEDHAKSFEPVALPLKKPITPRSFQAKARDAWIENGKQGVVVLPTGAGKTVLAVLLISLTERPTLIHVPTIDLMHQWIDVLSAHFDEPIGALGGGSHEIERLTVSTYDSALIHATHKGNAFGFVIYDECHHLPSEQYQFTALATLAPFRLGLTATPERADGREAQLYEWLGGLCFTIHIDELEGNTLAPYDVETIEIDLNDEERAIYDETRANYIDFLRSEHINMSSPRGWQTFIYRSSLTPEGRQAFQAYLTQKRLSQAAAGKEEAIWNLLQQHRGDLILIFTQDNDMAYRLGRRFLLPVLTHQTKVKERKAFLDAFRAGDYRILVTSKVLNEGVDVPEANVAIVVSGSGSIREHVQRLGRVLRARPGKRATLYELIARDTGEYYINERRRQHRAYERFS